MTAIQDTTPAAAPPAAGVARPRVIGLDLSLTASGVASSLGWCETVGRAGITKLDLAGRYRAIAGLADQIAELAKGADLVTVEKLTFSRVDGGRGGAGERAGLYWLVIRHLALTFTPVAEVPTGTLKKYATGKGSGGKGPVIEAVTRRWPHYETGGDDNACDAVVLAAMGADHLGHPLAPMPAAHRTALDAVTWPDRTTAPGGPR